MRGNNTHTFQFNLQKTQLKSPEISQIVVNLYQNLVFDIV